MMAASAKVVIIFAVIFVESRAEKMCGNTSSVHQLVGCVMSSLVSSDSNVYSVVMQDPHKTTQDPAVCWTLCEQQFPNTSLALVAKQQSQDQDTLLECRCSLAGVLQPEQLGPSIFCHWVCPGSLQCGGTHTFRDDGVQERFFSVYCVNEDVDHPPPPSTPYPIPTDLDAYLSDIMYALVTSNVAKIIIVCLLIMLLFIICLVLIWVYVFVESLGPNPSSVFYRGSSSKRPSLSQNHGRRHPEGYGTNNLAYDPTLEGNDESDSSTPRAISLSPNGYPKPPAAAPVMNHNDALPDDDFSSQTSIETEPANDALPNNIPRS